MDSDSNRWPSWVYHWNGHQRTVNSQEEFDALPPGYSLDGIPDPESLGLPWRNVNEQCGGPFAPYRGYQHAFPTHRSGGPMSVCAIQGCVYNYRWRSPGEKFNLEDRGEDQALWDSGAIVASPSIADPRYKHLDTGCFFRDEIALAHYAQCYERDDTAGVGFTATPATTEQARRRPGRPAEAVWRTWTLEEVRDILKRALPLAQEAYPDRADMTLEIVAAYTDYPRQYFSYFFRKHYYTWRTFLPLLRD